MDTNIDDWNIRDPAPGIALDQIALASERALAMMLRDRSKPILKRAFINILGAIEMIAGMEYHRDNFVRYCVEISKGHNQHERHLRDEAVAYLNRMGQFNKFATSNFVKNHINQDVKRLTPTIQKLKVFRDKHVAHRSIDAPFPNDTAEHQFSHARSLSILGGSLLIPKPNAPRPSLPQGATADDMTEFLKAIWQHSYLAFQIFDASANASINFALEADHDKVMREVRDVMNAILK